MIIYVGSALKQKEIIETLENDLGYKYIGKKAITMQFEIGDEDVESAIAKAKTAIKGTSYGKVLYFSVKDNEFGK